MTSDTGFSGVLVPANTPFNQDLSVDGERFVRHCRYLLDQGADGLAPFGTTGEANSIPVDERMDLLERLLDAGIPPHKLMPGTGACAVRDAIRVTRQAVEAGCNNVLMLPPFYYKNPSDDGLFAFFSEVLQGVGSDALKIYLYHIPQVSQVGLGITLVSRLIEAYPDNIVGIKDSSGDWANTESLIRTFPGFQVFAGTEVLLLDVLRAGGAGCITATGNVNLRHIRKVYENRHSAEADQLQQAVTSRRKLIQRWPMVPALKAILAHRMDDPPWARVAPPMTPLPAGEVARLLSALDNEGFEMAPAGSHA